MPINLEYFPAVGGLNQEAPPLAMQPGELVDVANYECLPNGGYRRIYGYELYDGQAASQQPVPGSGPIVGVHIYQGHVYALREDGSNARMFRATSSGWTEVDSSRLGLPAAAFAFVTTTSKGRTTKRRCLS